MKTGRLAIERPHPALLPILFCLPGGAAGCFAVGKLADPAFTLKPALVITPYPGASASAVSAEMSAGHRDRGSGGWTGSEPSPPGTPRLRVVEVEVLHTSGPDELPRVRDSLRDRVAYAAANLPDGACPFIMNDFGDVFGVCCALTSPDTTDAEIREIASCIRGEAVAIDGVANAVQSGLPAEAIFVEPDSRVPVNPGVDCGGHPGCGRRGECRRANRHRRIGGCALRLDRPPATTACPTSRGFSRPRAKCSTASTSPPLPEAASRPPEHVGPPGAHRPLRRRSCHRPGASRG